MIPTSYAAIVVQPTKNNVHAKKNNKDNSTKRIIAVRTLLNNHPPVTGLHREP